MMRLYNNKRVDTTWEEDTAHGSVLAATLGAGSSNLTALAYSKGVEYFVEKPLQFAQYLTGHEFNIPPEVLTGFDYIAAAATALFTAAVSYEALRKFHELD